MEIFQAVNLTYMLVFFQDRSLVDELTVLDNFGNPNSITPRSVFLLPFEFTYEDMLKVCFICRQAFCKTFQKQMRGNVIFDTFSNTLKIAE